MKKFEIYTIPNCPHCVRAKDLLNRKHLAYTEYVVNQNGITKHTIQERVNKLASNVSIRTVPQIFLFKDGMELYIGGADDLYSKIDTL